MSNDLHVLGLLSFYLDGALSKKRRQDLETHLETCVDCRLRAETLGRQRQMLRDSPTLTPPPSFYREVWDRVDRKTKPRDGRNPWAWGMPTKAFATACVLAVVVMVSREARQPGVSVPTDALKEFKPPVERTAIPLQPESRSSSLGPSDAGRPTSASAPEPLPPPTPMSVLGAGARLQAMEKEKIQAPGVHVASAKRVMAALSENNAAVSTAPPSDQPTSANNIRRESPVPATPAVNQGSSARLDEISMAAKAATPVPLTSNKLLRKVEKKVETEPAKTEWVGSISGIRDLRTVVIQNTAEWQSLWNEHNGQTLPDVDFVHGTIVGVFAGNKPSAGYQVVITDVKNSSASVEVDYREQAPAPGIVAAAVITQPYHLRRIPKTTLPVHFVAIPPSNLSAGSGAVSAP